MTMADRTALGFIGYLMGGVTVAVMLIGGVVVNLNLPDDAPAMSRYSISLTANAR
jgi:hypothetical protein